MPLFYYQQEFPDTQALLRKYPYFSLLHLDNYTHIENKTAQEDAMHKLRLYFYNPFALTKIVDTLPEQPKASLQITIPSTPAKKDFSIAKFQPPTEITGDLNPLITSLIEKQKQYFDQPISEETLIEINTQYAHTMDYFASQGIEIASMLATDILSSRVLKFTDWLKQMKQLKDISSRVELTPKMEAKIQTLALLSNTAPNILTEAMAEVLVKQHKVKEAIELYQKLSFLNPEKSTYFASKIETLNA